MENDFSLQNKESRELFRKKKKINKDQSSVKKEDQSKKDIDRNDIEKYSLDKQSTDQINELHSSTDQSDKDVTVIQPIISETKTKHRKSAIRSFNRTSIKNYDRSDHKDLNQICTGYLMHSKCNLSKTIDQQAAFNLIGKTKEKAQNKLRNILECYEDQYLMHK